MLQVILPYYTSLPEDALVGLEHVADFECPKGEVWDGEMRQSSLASSVHRATVDGVPVLLIAPQNRRHSNLFVGDRIYGGSYNELEAYLYFCRCACSHSCVCCSTLPMFSAHCGRLCMLSTDESATVHPTRSSPACGSASEPQPTS